MIKRADWDKRVLRIMFAGYCRANHKADKTDKTDKADKIEKAEKAGKAGKADKTDKIDKAGKLCDECYSLLDYAFERIDNCPLGEKKTTCQRCAIHCYSPARVEQIRVVMRYSGKRLMLTHPMIAIRHLIKVILH